MEMQHIDILTLVLSATSFLLAVGYFKMKFDREWMLRDHEMEKFKESTWRNVDRLDDRIDNLSK